MFWLRFYITLIICASWENVINIEIDILFQEVDLFLIYLYNKSLSYLHWQVLTSLHLQEFFFCKSAFWCRHILKFKFWHFLTNVFLVNIFIFLLSQKKWNWWSVIICQTTSKQYLLPISIKSLNAKVMTIFQHHHFIIHLE